VDNIGVMASYFLKNVKRRSSYLKKVKFPLNRKYFAAKPHNMLNNASKTQKNVLKETAVKREKFEKKQKMLKNAIIIKIRALLITNSLIE